MGMIPICIPQSTQAGHPDGVFVHTHGRTAWGPLGRITEAPLTATQRSHVPFVYPYSSSEPFEKSQIPLATSESSDSFEETSSSSATSKINSTVLFALVTHELHKGISLGTSLLGNANCKWLLLSGSRRP